MRSRYNGNIALFLLLLLSSMIPRATAQSEKGYLPVFNFSPKTYGAHEQNFDVLQDHRGVMYFANNQGVLEYDGVNWNLISVADGATAFSLSMDASGRIYVGAMNEFGYLAPDKIGRLQYVSLTSRLDEDFPDFGEVWKTYATDGAVFFQCYDYIFVCSDSIRILKPETVFRETYHLLNSLFVQQDGIGLTRYHDGEFDLVEGGDFFADRQIYGMVPFDSTATLVATLGELYLMQHDQDGTDIRGFRKFQTRTDGYFQKNDINSLINIGESWFSAGTWGGGVVVFDRQGEIVEFLDKSTGLGDDIIYNQFMDERGNLWLALSYGLSRAEIRSPLTMFSDASGLTGTVQSITRFNNTIYVATLTGLYYLLNEESVGGDRISIKPRFVLIEELAFECWDLMRFENRGEELLLVVTNTAVMQVDRHNRVTRMQIDQIPLCIYQSRLVPARVYIGLESGLASVYRSEGAWVHEGQFDNIQENITQMSEDIIGNLWMGTSSEGVLKMNILSLEGDRIRDYKVFKYDTAHGLPEGPTIVSQISGPSVVATSEGLYKYNPVENWFKPDTTYGVQFADGSHFIHRISEYPEKGIWMVTFTEDFEEYRDKYKAGYLEQTGPDQYRWITEPFIRITEEVLQAIFVDDSNVTWLGGNGLYRYETENDKNYEQPFNTLLSRITLGADSMIFGGTYYNDQGMAVLSQPPELFYTLKYRYNSLIFNYAAPSGEDDSFLKFSYYLEGFDENWSDWSEETYKEYTNLHEGDYTFHVKAKNAYDHEGGEAVFSFSIVPPWYRTILAYIGYVIFFSVFVYTVVKVYTRQLRAIIRERTAEVVMQKEEIEMKNREITDSIQYASRIQSAVLPPGDLIDKMLPERFILYLPRDIVSGDFYWLYEMNSKVITVAADCTGHGVPGAFMSMLGVAFLNEIVSKVDDIHAHEILNQLRAHVIKSLHQTGAEGGSKDGMDIALCIYDMKNMKLEFAGANNPLYMIRDDELITYRADKMPIGIHQNADQSFSLNEIDLKRGDIMYTFSDGYADQFGGPHGKKFMSKNMKNLFLGIHKKDMETQKQVLKDSLFEWMKHTEQVDDVIVMGVRV